ncbi:Glycoside hydrolase family 47 [Penicillium coprophilum]|uniref:Glycoside hydrolase family 47 n=1 Tax=Penicillium coprophilum TaxID=36646 RepID=UPI00239341BD|nr:Glycoside hydrolase family 47 [Penicillium coprophilum]KAJ5169658.1 Glycoside hydrolase family 47 [Penicillium coprophilum]
MFRARRYRVLVVFAAAVVFTFFHFARSRDWSYTVVEEHIGVHPPDAHPNQPATPNPENPAAAAAIEESKNRVLPNPYRGTTSPTPEKIISPVGPNSGSKDGTSRLKEASSDTPPVQLPIKDDPKDSAKEPVKEPAKVDNTGSVPPPAADNINNANEEIDHGGTGRRTAERPKPGIPTTKWKKFPERFPVPAEKVIKLPKEQSKTIPKLQAKFKDESSSDKQERLQRLSAIKAEFAHAWKGYKEVAMGHDEVKPLSKEFEDPFNGWGATLVDSIDTLWIMQLKDEFSEALDVIKNIDFTTSLRADIPMFETTIRYLGGLLGAYDISGHRYPVLLEKAEELAEVLIGAFDTPNRMPHLYYRWAPEYAVKPHRASSRAGLAEIGSLSLEFTRLAQLTKRDKYYDAIARITNELEKIQDSTSIPGLWPLRVNAQGCPKYSKNTSPSNRSPTNKQNAASATISTSTSSMTRRIYAAPTDLESYLKLLPRDTNTGVEGHAQPANDVRVTGGPDTQTHEQNTLSADQCNGGLGLPNSPHDNAYTLGGMADSTYEYLPKEYLLLGGLNEQYLNMYKKAATAARKSLLFQPMVKGGRDIRFMASTFPITPGKTAELTSTDLKYEGTHLTCFVGGMFAIGAKAFGIEGDLELAAKLTDGCVWAYESTQTGVMPEHFRLLPCEKGSACEWDPARFEAGVDRNSRVDPEAGHSFRNGESSYKQRVDLISHDPPPGSASGSVPIPMPGSLNPHDSDVLAKRDGAGNHTEASPAGSKSAPVTDGAELQNRDAPRSSSSPASPHIAEVGKDHLPAGMTSIPSPTYYLRPEAIESVFIMYRLTGDESWRRKGWQMFEAISKYTRTELANAAIHDVTAQKPIHKDTMESFWLAETLKYFYLLFSDPTVVDLDKYVLNTEAHPFLRPVA